MKKFGFGILAMALVLVLSFPLFSQTQEDIQKYPTCTYCGMDRQRVSHSRMVIEYEDGSATGTCSLRCTAVDLAVQIGKTIKTIKVGDYNTKNLIEAQKAYWIIDGSKMGVMTKRSKWAFEIKEAADQFKTANGGETATYDQALKAAYEDLQEDTNTSRRVRYLRKRGMGHDFPKINRLF